MDYIKIAKILIGAKALIATPDKWIKFTEATDGICAVNYTNKKAKCFCLGGAISRSGFNAGKDYTVAVQARGFIRDVIGVQIIAYYNDKPLRTHIQVMRVLDKAITLALQKQKQDILEIKVVS
jgi:hypothetical protein